VGRGSGIGLVFGGVGLGVAGCGSAAHYLGGVVAHRALNHVMGRRNANRFFCLYRSHRVLVDLRAHNAFFAGLNAVAAWHACTAGFGRRR
jgi:hypothetical protein